jgi:Family of unknown function (DUF6998)
MLAALLPLAGVTEIAAVAARALVWAGPRTVSVVSLHEEFFSTNVRRQTAARRSMSHHSDTEFRLPLEVRPLTDARIAVRDYYRRKGLSLEFSFDGNLVGDFGEACAVEEYGMKLVKARSNAGFDGYTPDGKRTIEVKAKVPSTKSIAATRKCMPTTCSSSNSILIAAPAAPSTMVQSTMCGRSYPASRGRGRSRSPFRGFDKRRHGFAMTSISRWCARTTDSEAVAAPAFRRARRAATTAQAR